MAGKPPKKKSWNEVAEAVLSKTDLAAVYRSWGLKIASDIDTYDGWIICHRFNDVEDQHPSAGINSKTGVYNSFGSKGAEKESISIYEMGVKTGHYPSKLACLLGLAQKVGVDASGLGGWQSNEQEFPPWWKDKCLQDTVLESNAKIWCATKDGIDFQTVMDCGAHSVDWFGQKCLGFPAYHPVNPKKPTCWMVYARDGEEVRTKNRKGEFDYRKTTSATGSTDSLLGPDILAENEIVWKMEGVTDWLAARSLGLPAVSVTGGSKASVFLRRIAGFFSGKTVYICHDRDEDGIAGAKKSAQILARYAKAVYIVHLPYALEKKKGKDFRDWVTESNEMHTRVDAEALAAKADKWVVEEKITQDEKYSASAVIGEEDAPIEFRVAARLLNKCYKHGKFYTLIYWRDEFWHWTPEKGRYKKASMNEIRNQIIRFLASDDDVREELGDRCNKTIVSNIIMCVQAQCEVDSEMESPCYLTEGRVAREGELFAAFKNGQIDLKAAIEEGKAPKVQPNSPHWFSPVRLPYDFDAEAKCPLWFRFLRETFDGNDDLISLIQQWFGYCLQPRVDEMLFLVMEGDSKTGKSTVCHVLRKILGEENVSTVPLELFGERFQIYPTMGKLANIVTEVDDRPNPICEGMLKQYTGGDKVMADRKGKEPVEFYPTAKLIFATNVRPRFSDKSAGIWNRAVIVPFIHVVPAENRDRQLKQKLEEELPGILNWSLAGSQKVYKGRFQIPKVVTDMVDEARHESNPAAVFLEEYCTPSSNGNHIGTKRLYGDYKVWCTDNGHYHLSSTQFGREVLRAFPHVEKKQIRKPMAKGQRYAVYHGISSIADANGNGRPAHYGDDDDI